MPPRTTIIIPVLFLLGLMGEAAAGQVVHASPEPASPTPVNAAEAMTREAAPDAGADARAKAIESAAPTQPIAPAAQSDLLIKVQVLLDRTGFSPGAIDGRGGRNLSRALTAFEKAKRLPGSGEINPRVIQFLTAADPAAVTQRYVISPQDLSGPFLGKVPTDFVEMAKLKFLGYATPAEELAERFHMSAALLRALNPTADFSKAGTRLLVAKPSSGVLAAPVATVVVDKSADQVRALDASGRVLAMFPATVGSTERPAPSGRWAITAVVHHPNYTYDPKRLTFGDKRDGVLTIPPGPNNPVGSVWIALTTPTYGIHGSPDPNLIGKTASHGCVRMTNWDVATLASGVRKGTPVIFVGVAPG